MRWLLGAISRSLSTNIQHRKALKKEVGIVLINAKAMRELNKKFRNKNKVTDVLSFSGDDTFLGDIVLCVEQIKKQAAEHGLESSEEFSYLVLHGLMHLLGYDHEENEVQAKKMFRIQDKLFAELQDRDILKAFRKPAPQKKPKSRQKSTKKAPENGARNWRTKLLTNK